MQDFLIQLHQHIMDPDRIPFLVAALVLTAIIGIITGPMAGNANPLLWHIFSRFLGGFGDRLDRVARKEGDLIFRGFMVTSFAIILAAGAGKAFNIAKMMFPFHGIVEILVVSLCLSTGAVWYVLLRLYFAQDQRKTGEGGYLALSRSTRYDLNTTDEYGITRAGLGLMARAFDKGVVAPGLWYLIGGLPVLLVYACIAALAWRFGKNGFTKGFGRIPLVFEKLMGFIPSLLAGLLLCAASALTPTAKLHKSLMIWWSARNKAPYEQGGIVLSAVAWPLGIVLGGPVVDSGGSSLQNVWVGPEGASAQVDHNHMRRGLYLGAVAHLLFIFALLCAYVYAGRLF